MVFLNFNLRLSSILHPGLNTPHVNTERQQRKRIQTQRRKRRVGRTMRGLLVGNSEAGAEPNSSSHAFSPQGQEEDGSSS